MRRITVRRSSSSCAKGSREAVYNVGGEEHDNLEVTSRIVELTGADPALVRHVDDRPGPRPPLLGRLLANPRTWLEPTAALCGRPCRDCCLVSENAGTGGRRSSPVSTRTTTSSSTNDGCVDRPRRSIHAFLTRSGYVPAEGVPGSPYASTRPPGRHSDRARLRCGCGRVARLRAQGPRLGSRRRDEPVRSARACRPAGQDYKQILGFYYDGTNVGQTSQRKIRVLLT